MEKLKELIDIVESEKIDLITMPLKGTIKGLYGDNVIAISTVVDTQNEYVSVLAEELGHHFTSHGNILDLSVMCNKKQEIRAREWAHNKMVRISDIIYAYKWGIRNRYELADFLGVTEQFLIEWSETACRKCGPYVKIDNLVVYFNPLGVMEKF